MTPRQRSSRRTGTPVEDNQNTNANPTQVSQGQENQNPIQTYMSAIQTVIEKLDEVKDDVKKNSDNITKQVNKIDQVQAIAKQNAEEIKKLRQEMENQRNNPSIQLVQTIKAQIQQETLGPSYQAEILSYSNQIVIHGI